MRALFVVLALIAIGANAIQIKRSDSSWNFKLTTRSMANLPANLQAKATEINKLLTIYNARAEVAIGMAAQSGNQFTALQQVLEKAICITRAAFPASTDDAIYGGLFALPGSPYEKAWVDWHAAKQAVRQGYNPPPGGKDKAWVGTPFKDFDNDRWGPFLPSLVQYDNAPAKAAAMTAALTDNKNAVIKVINSDGKTPAADTNYRSLLHLFARMSIYGETKVANSKLPPANQFNLAHLGDMCPGSFRHALYTLHNAAAATKKDAETRCGLDLAKLTRQVAARNDMRGKNLIEFEDFSANFEAGSAPAQVGGKQVSNIAMARDPLAGAFRETRAKMLSQNTWTAARMTAAKMPPLTKYELGYLKAVTPAYNGVDAPPKFGAGGNVFDMKKTAQNTDWRDAMLANGLLMSGGPSGTTDEIMQFGDYTGVTKTTAGACALKNAPLAGMLLNTHHTFAEVMQGAADGNRNLPVFNFAAPYDGLKACNDGIFDKAKEYMALFNSGIQRSNDITSVIKGSDWGKVNHDGSAQTDRMGTDDGGNDATYGGHFRFEKADEALVDPTGAIWPQVCALSPAQFPGGATAKELLCVAPVARFAEVDEEADEAEEETEEEEEEDAEEEEEEDEEEEEEEDEEEEEEDLDEEEEEEDLDEEEEEDF